MKNELVFTELAVMFGIAVIVLGIVYGFSGRYLWGHDVIYPHLLEGTLLALVGGIYVSIGLIGYFISTAFVSSRICPFCGKNLSNLSEDIESCPYCGKALPTMKKIEVKPQILERLLKEYSKPLIEKYVAKYPHNPEGVLEFHVSQKMKEGKTREQAIEELTKES